MYFTMSWRNLWRNKRRTIIVVASVLFALLIALFMRSMQKGTYAYMIDSAVSQQTGYLQVQDTSYWEKRSVDYSISLDDETIEEIQQIEYVGNLIPRFETFALASSGNQTKVAAIMGIDPEKEDEMNGLSAKVIEGKYLDRNTEGLLIAEGLADLLGVTLGDSVVIYGQGYHGTTAAAFLPITGIAEFPIPKQNNVMIYMPLEQAQYVFGAYDMITGLAVMIQNERHLQTVQKQIAGVLPEQYVVRDWQFMMPELVQGIQTDEAGGIIMLFIIYGIVGLGIFGTIMMMTAERAREFGILISVGMSRWRLIFTTAIESVVMSMIGVFIGFILSIPILLYFKANPIRIPGEMGEMYKEFGFEPIMPVSLAPYIFIEEIIVVLCIALLCAIYPLVYIKNLRPMDAVRGI